MTSPSRQKKIDATAQNRARILSAISAHGIMDAFALAAAAKVSPGDVGSAVRAGIIESFPSGLRNNHNGRIAHYRLPTGEHAEKLKKEKNAVDQFPLGLAWGDQIYPINKKFITRKNICAM